MLVYCQLEHEEQISMKFWPQYKIFHSRKCICKYHLQYGGHFVQGEIILNYYCYFKLNPCKHISVKFSSKCNSFHSRKCICKMLSAKWRPFCLGFNVLRKKSNSYYLIGIGHVTLVAIVGTTILVPKSSLFFMSKSSHCNSFGDWAPADFIYDFPIFKWIAETWLTTRQGTYQDDSSSSGCLVTCLITDVFSLIFTSIFRLCGGPISSSWSNDC